MESLVQKCDVFFSDVSVVGTANLLKHLMDNVEFSYPTINEHRVKRGIASMGFPYAFSGITIEATPWDSRVLELMCMINEAHGTSFNACLLNYYPDGNVGITPHSDNVRELVPPAVVASVSLGATRTFRLESKDKQEKVDIPLKDGAVLIMGDRCQDLYVHSIPKQKCDSPRISLTFRQFKQRNEGMKLVIVESPAKAKTIGKYLGNGYVVRASVGHIRDIESWSKKDSNSKWGEKRTPIARKFGVDPDDSWAANYEVLKGKHKVVNEIVGLAKKASEIYLASDMDREGEAIAWHLSELIGNVKAPKFRVVFNEITKTSIKKAFETPGVVDAAMVDSQQCRRFLDRVVGYSISPLLWKVIARGLSAGRVQSVAVRLIYERELLIRDFKADEFWNIHVDTISPNSKPVTFEVSAFKDCKSSDVVGEEYVAEILEIISANTSKLFVTDVVKSNSKGRQVVPLTTSSLQQAANSQLGYSVKSTMSIAQKLYESGLITYMRTDSTALSHDAVSGARAFISKTYGDKYLSDTPIYFGKTVNSQGAHEAVRPTDLSRTPDQINLDGTAKKLYELIWKRTIATQMALCVFDNTTATIELGDLTLKAKGKVILFDGYLKVIGKEKDLLELPEIAVGDRMGYKGHNAVQKFTQPPARYSEAGLVKAMEKLGIGRPSTYASVIGTVQDRGYVKLNGKSLQITHIGEIVTDRLMQSFPDLMDYGFTSSVEADLDKIAAGEMAYTNVLDDFYEKLKSDIANADSGMVPNPPKDTTIECPTCQRHMQMRIGATGVFLGCSGYNDPTDKCKTTINLSEVPTEQPIACEKCGTDVDVYAMDSTRGLHVCSNLTSCMHIKPITGEFTIVGKAEVDLPTIVCVACPTGVMHAKAGRFGVYYECEVCKDTRSIKPNGKLSQSKTELVHLKDVKTANGNDYFIMRVSGNGWPYMSASRYPKVREMRSMTIAEFKLAYPMMPKHLQDKYKMFLDHPDQDEHGNPLIIKSHSKSPECQVVAIGKDGKPVGPIVGYF